MGKFSRYDFSTDNGITTLEITIQSEDNSYELTPGVKVPEGKHDFIEISYDKDLKLQGITHSNDFGSEIEEKTIPSVINYVCDNYTPIESTGEVDELLEVICEIKHETEKNAQNR